MWIILVFGVWVRPKDESTNQMWNQIPDLQRLVPFVCIATVGFGLRSSSLQLLYYLKVWIFNDDISVVRCYERATLIWPWDRCERTPLHGVCEGEKRGFVLCLTARGKKNLLSQSRNVLLLRSTPEQEEGFYTASLSGNRGPLKVAYLHLNCRRWGAKMSHCLSGVSNCESSWEEDHQLSPHTSSRIETCNFGSLVGVKSSADESSAGKKRLKSQSA